VVTKQERYTAADFMAKVEADADLNQLWQQLEADGCTTISEAGLTEQDDGLLTIWGEALAPDGLPRGLVRQCNGSACSSFRWKLTPEGPAWNDPAGQPAVPTAIGLPILLKQLEGHTFDKPTHVVDLALDSPPENVPDIDVSKRRFRLLSSIGPLWGASSLDLTGLRTLADQTGSFDTVTYVPYARTADVDGLLTSTHPYDVFVWFGQTVREEAKTNQVYKPIGMTVNAGIFGDDLYDRDRIEDMVALNPLGGPGLMLLAGCETMGDGNGGGEWDKSIPVTLDNQVRVLVGFEKCGEARDILAAAQQFLGLYFQGQTLGDAIAAVNACLAGRQSQLKMATLPEANLAGTFVADLDQYWEAYSSDGPPEATHFMANINIVNMCVDKSGKQYQENESFASAWSNEVSWQGPFFSGARKNPDNFVDMTLSGALMEIREGAHFFFLVEGDLGPKVGGLTLYGDALIHELILDKEKPDEIILKFKGIGRASPYTNEAGDTCQMQDPMLVSSTGELSTFKIPITWKNKPAN
jgi:hypothetical protein